MSQSKMSDAELVQAIFLKMDKEVSKKVVKVMLNSFKDIVMNSIVVDERSVELHNFGIFKPFTNKPRKFKDPQNGKTISKPAVKTAKFRLSSTFKYNLNK
jgi:DNA-binding protein HU-beta